MIHHREKPTETTNHVGADAVQIVPRWMLEMLDWGMRDWMILGSLISGKGNSSSFFSSSMKRYYVQRPCLFVTFFSFYTHTYIQRCIFASFFFSATKCRHHARSRLCCFVAAVENKWRLWFIYMGKIDCTIRRSHCCDMELGIFGVCVCRWHPYVITWFASRFCFSYSTQNAISLNLSKYLCCFIKMKWWFYSVPIQ